ncbi:ester cyclase [Streptomyces sp. NPDC050619]|uniref:ester cyclase n=1 Tax=Streptomyces sp. NPDC050619 TaxID=3157214 RepID=UPI003442C82A
MSLIPATSLDGFHLTWENQQADVLVREYFQALNEGTDDDVDRLLAPTFESHRRTGTTGRNGEKNRLLTLRAAFPDLSYEVHENVGVVVEGDMVALRTYVSGTHEGPYAGHDPTGRSFRIGNHHFFRHRNGRLVEHWEVEDSYRILAECGLIPTSIPLFDEMPGSPFGVGVNRQTTRPDWHKSQVRAMYEGVVATGNADDAYGMADAYIQNTGRAPDGASHFNEEFVGFRKVFQKGRAYQVQIVAERDRVITRSRWDGCHLGELGPLPATGRAVDFTTADTFRFEDGVIVEHWDTTDFLAMLGSLGVINNH